MLPESKDLSSHKFSYSAATDSLSSAAPSFKLSFSIASSDEPIVLELLVMSHKSPSSIPVIPEKSLKALSTALLIFSVILSDKLSIADVSL